MGTTSSEQLPEPVRRAVELGWSVVPQTPEKRALVLWTKYQRRPAPASEIARWNRRWPTCRWAIVTGRRSIVVLDFDGDEGLATMKRLGLRSTIRTPHGGAHVWVKDVPYRVVGGARVEATRFPGLDIRADGQVATFYGGGYRRLATDRTYAYEDLPGEIRSLFRRRRKSQQQSLAVEVPEDFQDAALREVLLGEALARLSDWPRNETGFWLACQLRDERHPRSEIKRTMLQYADMVTSAGDHEYTRQEAYDSMVSALSQVPRAPRALRDAEEIGLMSDVSPEPVRWLWNNRILLGKVNMIEGDPDRGKSTVTLDVAARVTTGRALPGEDEEGEPRAVLVISAEDDIADTIQPRMEAAGADLTRVSYMKLSKDEKGQVIPLSIPEDLGKIRRAIKNTENQTRLPAALVIIDPITAYLSEKIHYGNDPQVRTAMFPLKQLAEETGVAVLLVRHLNKDGGLKAIARGGGSIAFSASARSVLVAERHPEKEGVYVLARVKNNLAPAGRAITYRIESGGKSGSARIAWGEEIDIDADTLLSAGDGRRDAPARREAETFLKQLLADGPVGHKEIEAAAKAAGHTMKTVTNAKKSLGVKSERVRGKDGETVSWRWELPFYRKGNTLHFDFGD